MPAVGIIHRPAAPGIWQARIADADQDRHRIPAAEIVEIAVRHTSPGVLAGCEKYQQCGYEPCLFQFLYFISSCHSFEGCNPNARFSRYPHPKSLPSGKGLTIALSGSMSRAFFNFYTSMSM